MRAPLVSAHGATRTRPLILVRLTDADGCVGYGEAAPLQSYDGVSAQDVVAALEAWPGGEELPPLPQAAAAIDLARWDLAGRRAAEPVWRLLGAPAAEPVAVGATIGAEEPAAAAALARQARAAGFGLVKLKVGVGGDRERVNAVREAGLPVRLDANGAWTVAEAISALGAFGPEGIELCEEPVHGADGLASVSSQTVVPIAADETDVLDRRVCQAVCLKVASSGGITGLMRDAGRARAAGYEVYLASTFDGPLGIAAALHAAAAIGPERPCGLATLGLFADEDPDPPLNGLMQAAAVPGLGVDCRQFS